MALSRLPVYSVVFSLLLVGLPQVAHSQDIKDLRERGREMLGEIKKDIKAHYYDPNFRGVDLEARFKEADAQITGAVTGDQIYGIIAHTLLAFGDSHTYFIPPVWSLKVDYGWEMQMIGDKCLVTSVDGGSDAHAKGLRPGDQVLTIFDIPVSRANLGQITYLFYRLRPVKGLLVLVRDSGGKTRQLELLTKVEKATWGTIAEMEEERKYSPQYYLDVSEDLFIWKMPAFTLGEKGVDEMMKKVGKHKTLILDLRGNGGGYEVVLQHLLGYFFDHDVKIGERRGRKESKPVIAKTQREKVFRGRLFVLVDSASASAAELFARVVQLEKRGSVIGDRTAGAVTEARRFTHEYFRRKGFLVSALAVTYGVSVTVNDLIMADGKSLENSGVFPDEIILPTSRDLAANNDIVLLRAAALAGVQLDLKKMTPHLLPGQQ
jgi:C-terminal processing protease CtpA/Prc